MASTSVSKNRSWFSNPKHISIHFSKIKGWKNVDEEVWILNTYDNNTEILQKKDNLQVKLFNLYLLSTQNSPKTKILIAT